jgi:hypothetical protein
MWVSLANEIFSLSLRSPYSRTRAVTSLSSFCGLFMTLCISPRGWHWLPFIHVHEINPATHYTGNEWVYPGLVQFTPDEVLSLIARSGLHGAELTWYHPRQTWYVLSHSVDRVNWAVAACNNVMGKNVFEGVY